MELRQLRYFVQIAESLSFSEAAKRLFISQSTLSQQIRQLEAEFGVSLLCRDSHSVALTEAGERLLPLALSTIEHAESCRHAITDMQENLTGTLKIGISYTGSSVITEVVRDFVRAYPKVRVYVHYTNVSDIYSLLHNLQLDVVLAYNITPNDLISSQELYKDHLYAVFSSSHPDLAPLKQSKQSISLAELAKMPLALPSNNLQSRHLINRIAEENNITLDPRIEIDDPNLLFDLVEHSRFVTIQAGISTKVHSGLSGIRIDEMPQTYIGCAHTLKDSYVKRATSRFVQMVTESLSYAMLKM